VALRLTIPVVLAGLVPAIHALLCGPEDVDARDKPGHDGGVFRSTLSERAPAIGRLFAVLLVAAATPAAAQERILNFVSDVTVERNGDLQVSEIIRVQAEGNQFRHGIVRDFPTIYARCDGTRVVVGFEVNAVTRDGAAETFTTEALGNGVRIRVGRADAWLSRGAHDFVIRYRATRQVGTFADFDELTWNATGNGWTLPIDAAEARITLPDAVAFRRTAFTTGPPGSTARDATVSDDRPGRIVFRTTAPLPPRNGLTVAAAWPKGVVDPPSAGRLARWWVDDHIAAVVAGVALLLVAAGYGLAWLLVGRDPPRGTIIPLFAPPDGMSAASVRYVDRREFDDRAFSAAIVDLAVRGHLKIHDKGKTKWLERRGGGAEIATAEQTVKAKLFAGGDSVELARASHRPLGRARNALDDILTATYAEKLFRRNTAWAVAGVVLWAVAVLVTFATFALTSFPGDASGLLYFGLLVPVGLIMAGTVMARRAAGRGRRALMRRALGGVLALGGAALGLSAWLANTDLSSAALPGLMPLITAPLAVLGFSWLKAATVEGRNIIDRIDGFRLYLGIAEEDRLEALNPPHKTAELFERFLPYAIALDVENSWAQKFGGVLAAAAAGAAAGVAAATWYSGSDDWSANPAGFADHLGDDFSAAIASASSPPGSSSGSNSGSDGGGSSGDGGGGGGGSGW
jgi:uncharacterized membrane protein YgcG